MLLISITIDLFLRHRTFALVNKNIWANSNPRRFRRQNKDYSSSTKKNRKNVPEPSLQIYL